MTGPGARGGAGARHAALFASESRELLGAAQGALASLGAAVRAGDRGDGALDAVFRAMHSLKGMAGAMEYRGPEALAHAAEAVLDAARAGALSLAPEHVDALVATVDALDGAVDACIAGRELDVTADVESLRLLAVTTPARAVRARRPESALVATPGTLVARVRLAADTPLPGVRAQLVLRALGALGTVEACAPAADALFAPDFDGVFALRLRTDAAPEALEHAARAAGDVAEVRIDGPARDAASRSESASGAPASDALVAAPPTRGPARDTGTRDAHVRVDRARLDALVDVAGELALARARLTAAAAGVADPALAIAAAEVARLVGVLHEEVRAARTAPASDVFDRLPRVVREVARAVGKRAELVIEGGDVALDRSLLEELTDPLVHLLRNAVDHGIEPPEERAAAGKSPVGRVVLRAARERDGVVVSVRDDGRGIDRARVAALAGEGRGLDDSALLSAIARPGLSTAERVSQVSGRGVGVDAVRERVLRAGGSLALETAAGQGTCLTIRLPLTLAVGRALVARVGGETYAIPVAQVRETVDAPAASLTRDGRGEALRLRDESIPVLRLAEALGVAPRGARASDDEAEVLDAVAPEAIAEAVVVESAGRRAALLVDAIDGQQDVLVKPLPRLRGAPRLFGGATILVDGTPALVLDPQAFVAPAQAGALSPARPGSVIPR